MVSLAERQSAFNSGTRSLERAASSHSLGDEGEEEDEEELDEEAEAPGELET